MRIGAADLSREPEIVQLFVDTFTASDGSDEGKMVGALAAGLLDELSPSDLYAFAVEDGGEIIAAIVFSRMTFGTDPRSVFILSPVAVRTDHQRSGIGASLIRHGLDVLASDGVDIALTYGDPAYYTRFGYEQIDEATVPAPQNLSHPHGWLGQVLAGGTISPLPKPVRCAKAMDNPLVW